MLIACVAKQVILTEEDFQWALRGFTPSVLLNVPLLPPGDLTWKDVGGLQDVRQVLEQTLLWPSKVQTVPMFHLKIKYQRLGCLFFSFS